MAAVQFGPGALVNVKSDWHYRARGAVIYANPARKGRNYDFAKRPCLIMDELAATAQLPRLFVVVPFKEDKRDWGYPLVWFEEGEFDGFLYKDQYLHYHHAFLIPEQGLEWAADRQGRVRPRTMQGTAGAGALAWGVVKIRFEAVWAGAEQYVRLTEAWKKYGQEPPKPSKQNARPAVARRPRLKVVRRRRPPSS